MNSVPRVRARSIFPTFQNPNVNIRCNLAVLRSASIVGNYCRGCHCHRQQQQQRICRSFFIYVRIREHK